MSFPQHTHWAPSFCADPVYLPAEQGRRHDTDSASWEISLGTDSRHENGESERAAIIYPQQDDETRQDLVARREGRKQSESNAHRAQDRTKLRRGYPLYPPKDPTLATCPIIKVSSQLTNFSAHELPWQLQMLSLAQIDSFVGVVASRARTRGLGGHGGHGGHDRNENGWHE